MGSFEDKTIVTANETDKSLTLVDLSKPSILNQPLKDEEPDANSRGWGRTAQSKRVRAI